MDETTPTTLPDALTALASLRQRVAALEQKMADLSAPTVGQAISKTLSNATIQWATDAETSTVFAGWYDWRGCPKNAVQTGFKVNIDRPSEAAVHYVELKIVPK
jgi:hypothetical protein